MTVELVVVRSVKELSRGLIASSRHLGGVAVVRSVVGVMMEGYWGCRGLDMDDDVVVRVRYRDHARALDMNQGKGQSRAAMAWWH